MRAIILGGRLAVLRDENVGATVGKRLTRTD
jgi:hypothetical protein